MSTLTGGQGNIITNGLVLRLDAANPRSYQSGSTTWNDLSSNGKNGTLTNGPTFNTSSSGAIRLDGVDDYISVPNIICTGVGFTGTIEIITNCTGSLITNERESANQGDGNFIITSSGSLSAGVNSNGNPPYTYFLTSSIPGNLNQVNHYIASYTIPSSTGTMSGILGTNGVFESLSTSIVVNGTISNYLNVNIGRQRNFTYGTFYSTAGNIYIVRIYNRRLSQQEMLQNYDATRARFGL
jgi:hypothetical protein